MTNYNDGKWHGWNGGQRSVHPRTVIELVTVDGLMIKDRTAVITKWSGTFLFRVTKEHKEPREVFLSKDPDFGVWGEVLPEHKYAVKFREVTE